MKSHSRLGGRAGPAGAHSRHGSNRFSPLAAVAMAIVVVMGAAVSALLWPTTEAASSVAGEAGSAGGATVATAASTAEAANTAAAATAANIATAATAASTPQAANIEPAELVVLARKVREHMNVEARHPRISNSGYDIAPLGVAEIAKLAEALTPEQRRITLERGTEPSFCGGLLDNKEEGLYACVVCGLPLFESSAKFDSGTGWPSFYEPFDDDHILEKEDRGAGMVRTEILCTRCGAHLGHVFADGPRPTGLRYCLNSAALNFLPASAALPERSRPVATETAYFAGGCFWGIEDRFARIPGVLDAVSGYMGGEVSSPSYQQVCTGRTGHAEAVKVVYDPTRVSYGGLLSAFFGMHDPTQVNRQGPDVGTQYRSAIFPASDEQDRQARAHIRELAGRDVFKGREIATRVERAETFYPAEEYHQDYHVKHGGSCAF